MEADKDALNKFVKQNFEDGMSEKENPNKLLEEMQEDFENKHEGYAKHPSQIRQRALAKYFDRLSGRKRRGTNREVRRFVTKWLDKVGAQFIDTEMSEDFLVISERYALTLSVKVARQGNTYGYDFEWLASPEIVDRHQ